jgi:hypothetical protein
VEETAVCDTAEPAKAHSKAVDRIATAKGATKPDNNFKTISSQIRDGLCRPNLHDTARACKLARISKLDYGRTQYIRRRSGVSDAVPFSAYVSFERKSARGFVSALVSARDDRPVALDRKSDLARGKPATHRERPEQADHRASHNVTRVMRQ